MGIVPRNIDMSRIFDDKNGNPDPKRTPKITYNPEWTPENPRGGNGVDNYMINKSKDFLITQHWKVMSDTSYHYTYDLDAVSFVKSMLAKWDFYEIPGQPNKCIW